MKKIIVCLFILSFFSCESYFGDTNKNPNSPIEVSVDVVLTAVEVEMADWYGGELSRFVNMITRQMEGVNRCGTYYYYNGLLPASFSTMWANNYANILAELHYIKKKSVENNFYHYEATANILMAFQLMQATDIWNDIPWDEALKGIDNRTPRFDSQTSIYNEINSLLADAILLLEGENGGFEIHGDLIYNGNTEQWKKAAYALQARSAVHWGFVDASNFTKAIEAAQKAFEGNEDDLALPFPGTAGNEAPMYRFFRDRTGDMEFDPVVRQMMTNLNDTARMGLLDKQFYTSHPYFTADRVEPMITYRELKFIEAESLLRTNGSAEQIRNAYLEGIRASFEHLGLENAYSNYVQQNQIDPGLGNITFNHILTQKYLGLYSLSEVYNDMRRTGLPNIQPTNGLTIPVRFPYAESEIAANPNVPIIDIFEDKVEWDVN